MWGNTNFRHIIYAHSMPTTIVPTGKQVTQLTNMKTRAVNIILLIHLNPKCTGNSMGNLNSSNKNDARNWVRTHCVFFISEEWVRTGWVFVCQWVLAPTKRCQKSEYTLCTFSLLCSGSNKTMPEEWVHTVYVFFIVFWLQQNDARRVSTHCVRFLYCVLAPTKRCQKSEYTLCTFSLLCSGSNKTMPEEWVHTVYVFFIVFWLQQNDARRTSTHHVSFFKSVCSGLNKTTPEEWIHTV